jgi:hypothetical protein
LLLALADSSAAAAVISLKVEPGSYIVLTASTVHILLRYSVCSSGVILLNFFFSDLLYGSEELFGSNSGVVAIASMSPVFGLVTMHVIWLAPVFFMPVSRADSTKL